MRVAVSEEAALRIYGDNLPDNQALSSQLFMEILPENGWLGK